MPTSVTGRSIAVDGLSETMRGLKKIRPELGRIAAKANRDLTKEIILPAARRNWATQRIKPSVANRAVVAAAGANWAGVRSKAKSFPYGAGVTFGARAFPQFRPWVGNQISGTGGDYIVSPAVREKGDEFSARFMANLERHLVEAID